MISSIKEILDALPVKARVKEYGLLKDWDRLVGQQIAIHCQPERLKDGVLHLKVDSPAWMQQLHFMKSMILEKLRSHSEGDAVRDLRFQIGKIIQTRKITGRPWKEMTLTREDLARIEDEVSSVKDPELREIMKKLRARQAQVMAWRDQSSKGSSFLKSPR